MGNSRRFRLALEGAVVGCGYECLFLSFCVYVLLPLIYFEEGLSVAWPKKRQDERSGSTERSSDCTHPHNNKHTISTQECPLQNIPQLPPEDRGPLPVPPVLFQAL